MNQFTNGILTISDGTIKGKVIIIGCLIILAIFFLIRANLQWKVIEKILEEKTDKEKEQIIQSAATSNKLQIQEDPNQDLRRKFVNKAKKNKYKERKL